MNAAPYPPKDFPMHHDGGNIGQTVPSKFMIVMNVVNAVTQMCLGGVMVAAFTVANILNVDVVFDPFDIFRESYSEHIFLCVTGYVILISQAVLTFNPYKAGWTHALMYPQKRMIHWGLQVLGSVLAFAGVVVRLNDNVLKANFMTNHGILGISALVVTIVNLVGGLINLVCGAKMSNNCIKVLHGLLGTAATFLAYVTICVAFNTTGRRVMGHGNANMAITLTVFAMAGILLASCSRMLNRLLGNDHNS